MVWDLSSVGREFHEQGGISKAYRMGFTEEEHACWGEEGARPLGLREEEDRTECH